MLNLKLEFHTPYRLSAKVYYLLYSLQTAEGVARFPGRETDSMSISRTGPGTKNGCAGESISNLHYRPEI
jgi:hypothetical protein